MTLLVEFVEWGGGAISGHVMEEQGDVNDLEIFFSIMEGSFSVMTRLIDVG